MSNGLLNIKVLYLLRFW